MSDAGVGLLVSVRSLEEARAALEGGCTVVDVKEPGRGPLGMADPEVIREVTEWGSGRGVATSMAMGEVVDWSDSQVADWESLSVDFAKLGLSGLARDDGPRDGPTDWPGDWQSLREQLSGPREWIAVAYADAERCGAPELELVVAAAIEGGCAGVLIDTWDKTGGGLRDHVSPGRLESVRDSTRAAGLLLALAGKVSLEDLPEVTRVQPDLVAVRSAACRDGRRELEIEADRVRELADRLGCASVSVGAWRHAG